MEKVIHYCWFGGKPLTYLAEKCIDSWKKFMPDYKIQRWDESNFNILNSIQWVKDTYDYKNWAMCVDYIRLWIIYNYGGIYLDTDVELINNLYDINYNFFAIERGFNNIAFGLGFGQDKNSPILKEHMKIYEEILTYDHENKYKYISPKLTTSFFKNKGIAIDNPRKNYQIGNTTIYNQEYFSPIDYCTKEKTFTLNTKAIHHYAESWK